MLWVALASVIMNLTGFGDDTAFVRDAVEKLRKAVTEVVDDRVRETRAVAAVNDMQRSFEAHRDRLATHSACLEQVDHTYAATREQYMHCDEGLDELWQSSIDTMVAAELELRAALDASEWAALEKELGGGEQP